MTTPGEEADAAARAAEQAEEIIKEHADAGFFSDEEKRRNTQADLTEMIEDVQREDRKGE